MLLRTIPTHYLRQSIFQLHRIAAMADPDHDTATAPFPPAPLSGANDAQRPNASGVPSGADHNCLASEEGFVRTPPRQLRFSPRGSEISSLTMTSMTMISASANTSEAAAYATTPLAGSKRPASSLDNSPSTTRPDYNVAKSSGDSVASGDDSGQW